MPSNVAAMVLAGGASRRFGSAKVLAPLGGQPLVTWAVRAAQEEQVGTVIVVGPAKGIGLKRALKPTRARVVTNPQSKRGLAHSIAHGIGQVMQQAPDMEALLILHGDQPLLPSGLLRRLIAAWHRTGRPAVVPCYRGTVAPPVLVGKSLWPDMQRLRGDLGGKKVLMRDPDKLVIVYTNAQLPIDIDTLSNLRTAEKQLRGVSC